MSLMAATAGATLAACAVILPAAALANGAFPAGFSVFFPTRRPEAIVLTTNFGVVESVDSGRTWRYACEDPERAMDARLYTLVDRVANTSPSDGSGNGADIGERLFTVGAQGLAVSDDGGCQLTPTAGSTAKVAVSDYFVDPGDSQRLLALTSLFETAAGTTVTKAAVLESRDGGRTFARTLRSEVSGTPESLDFESVEISRKDPAVIYLVSSSIVTGRQLERSSDGGLTWQRTPLPPTYGSRFSIITIDRDDPDTLFLRGSNSASDFVLISTDGGKTISPVVDLTAEGGVVTAFLVRGRATPEAPHQQTILVGARDGSGGGFGLRSTDGGRTFQPWPMGGLRLRGLAERQGRIFALAEQGADPFVLGWSDDEGASWHALFTFADTTGIKACAQTRCQADCLKRAETGLWSPAVCAPSAPPPGNQADGGPARDTGSGCGCGIGGDDAGDVEGRRVVRRGLDVLLLLAALWGARPRRFPASTAADVHRG